MKVTYYINGVSFDSLGVKVSKSKGLIDALKMRDPLRYFWPEHHGELVDLAAPRLDVREITLDCFISAANSTAFILAVQAFLAAFQKTGTQRLMVDVNDGDVTRKPLLYEVYLAEDIEITKKWSSSKMIGTFNLKLREPEPVKRVYKFTSAAGAMMVSMAITSDDPVNIYWGDGSVTRDVVTSSGPIEHTYTSETLNYIILTGIIENITGITTGATLVWNRL